MKKKRVEKIAKSVTGYGVVGTWVSPRGMLGGSVPQVLSRDEDGALYWARTDNRLKEFSEDTEQWLCEITIKPIRKVEKVTVFE